MGVKLRIKQTAAFTARNIRVFFKDKGAFISALISPLVILLLYVLFLHGVLKGTFTQNLGDFKLDAELINGFVASFEVSSILAVCGVTVAFVANMSMVDDRVTGVRADLDVSPAPRGTLVFGYYLATFIITVAICLVTLAAGLLYIAASGWAMSVGDCFCAILDVILNAAFGTALSSVVCYFLKSKSAITAVSTIVSTVYGFICGAYYPVSQFATGISNTVMCLPGTYFTALLRTHFMGGFGSEFLASGMPASAAKGILDSLDVNFYFFGSKVPVWAMYVVAVCAVIVLVAIFVLINTIKIKRIKK
ncbi:MAG: ABC transporter permease [Clostridiales bacterium]|nr:ABC transporter permease [Clostridiales bacterium]